MNKKPRHGRLFDLIRQKHQADTTVAEFRGHVIRKISAQEFAQLKAAAARSLRVKH
jgi:hypothetical protein